MRAQGTPSIRVMGRASLRARAMTWMGTGSLRAVPKFQRGLSDSALDDVTSGRCAPLLRACRTAGLDLRIRDNYLTAYAAGRAVALIKWHEGVATVELHHKFLRDDAFHGLTRCRRKDYWSYPVTPEFVAQFEHEAPRLVAAAQAPTGADRHRETEILCDNAALSHFVCVDRQLQMPTRSGRVDLVAVTKRGEKALALIEVRSERDSSLQHTPAQLLHYVETFAPSAQSGLREDVAISLARVATQLKQLGCTAPEPSRIEPGMPVLGLVALLCERPNPQLLAPMRAAASALPRPIYLWSPTGQAPLVIPPVAEWEVLHSPDVPPR
jgi:hypothetical protein